MNNIMQKVAEEVAKSRADLSTYLETWIARSKADSARDMVLVLTIEEWTKIVVALKACQERVIHPLEAAVIETAEHYDQCHTFHVHERLTAREDAQNDALLLSHAVLSIWAMEREMLKGKSE